MNSSSTCSAAASNVAGSLVGAGRVALRVEVENGANRTFTATRAAGRPSVCRSAATCRASSATPARTSSQSVRFCW